MFVFKALYGILKGILIGTIFLVKRFPTLSDQVYISIRHVNTIRQDSKGLRLF